MRLRSPDRPPERLRTRLLTVGPIPPEWGGELRGGVTRFNVTLLDEFRTRPWRHRIEPLGVLIPPPQRIRRRVAEMRSPLPVFMQPEGGRPRRFTRLLIEEERPDVVLLNNLAAFNGARYAKVHAQVAPGAADRRGRPRVAGDPDEGGRERGERYIAGRPGGLDGVAAVVFPSEHTPRPRARRARPALPGAGARHPQPAPAGVRRAGARRRGAARGRRLRRLLQRRARTPAPCSEPRRRCPASSVTMQGRGPLEEELRGAAAELGLAERVTSLPSSTRASTSRRSSR